MEKDFAIRLDQAYSLLNPVGREVTKEDIDRCREALLILVKEAYEAEA